MLNKLMLALCFITAIANGYIGFFKASDIHLWVGLLLGVLCLISIYPVMKGGEIRE
jgi:hypothetical protein